MARTITVEIRAHDYHVFLNGDRRLWECGKTVDEAIGKLIRTYSRKLDISIIELSIIDAAAKKDD